MKKEKENTAPVNEEQAEKNDATADAEALKKELEELNEKYMRVLAEYANFRNRSQKEKEHAYFETKSDVLSSFLPIVDNVGRALSGKEMPYEDYKQGAEMIFRQMIKTMSDLGVTPFGKTGETFDPNFHNAVMHIEDEKYGEKEIVQVFEKGYMLGEKVLRPATVQVAN